jgi:hypothetical protein
MQLLSVAKEVHSTFQEGSQETLATMSGMGLGMLLAHVNRGHDFAVWVSFLSLTIFHMFGECVITLFYAYRFFYHIVNLKRAQYGMLLAHVKRTNYN